MRHLGPWSGYRRSCIPGSRERGAVTLRKDGDAGRWSLAPLRRVREKPALSTSNARPRVATVASVSAKRRAPRAVATPRISLKLAPCSALFLVPKGLRFISPGAGRPRLPTCLNPLSARRVAAPRLRATALSRKVPGDGRRAPLGIPRDAPPAGCLRSPRLMSPRSRGSCFNSSRAKHEATQTQRARQD